jgi:hypothetical protein
LWARESDHERDRERITIRQERERDDKTNEMLWFSPCSPSTGPRGREATTPRADRGVSSPRRCRVWALGRRSPGSPEPAVWRRAERLWYEHLENKGRPTRFGWSSTHLWRNSGPRASPNVWCSERSRALIHGSYEWNMEGIIRIGNVLFNTAFAFAVFKHTNDQINPSPFNHRFPFKSPSGLWKTLFKLIFFLAEGLVSMESIKPTQTMCDSPFKRSGRESYSWIAIFISCGLMRCHFLPTPKKAQPLVSWQPHCFCSPAFPLKAPFLLRSLTLQLWVLWMPWKYSRLGSSPTL